MSCHSTGHKSIFSNFLIIFFALIFFASFAFAAHTSTVNLEPEWSSADTEIDYDVTFCKTTGDTVNEVRIYKNYDGSINYTGFVCDDLLGWEKLYIGTYPACFYVADDSSPDYNPLDVDGECQTFSFTAHTPVLPPLGQPPLCSLEWRFETRDIDEFWQFKYDNTSVDDLEPSLVKLVSGPQDLDNTGELCPNGPGDGQECWITTNTNIAVQVTEEGRCEPSSGLDYCEVTYTLDSGVPQTIVYEDLDGELYWEHDFYFGEDSVHALTVECKDRAGNLLTDTEVFRVDSTPPVTTKTYGDPSFPEGINTGASYPHWITTSTPITLDAQDGGDICHIDGVTTYYYDTVVDNSYCAEEVNCKPVCPLPIVDKINCVTGECPPSECEWQIYEGSFTKDEESCHILQFYSVDALGNIEEMNHQCVFVEDQPPVQEKTVGEPRVPLCDAREPEAYTETFTQDDFSQQVFNVNLVKEWNTVDAKWTVDLSGIEGHWSTGVQVIITDGTNPLFLVGWSPGENTSAPIYKEYNGGWGSPTTALPAGITVSGNYNETHYEIVIPAEYLNGCDYGWAINTEASWPDHSKSVQQNYPADWVRWTGTNAAGSGINDWWVTTGSNITLSCDDLEPHPVDHEQVCYKISFDEPATPWLTDQYCGQFGGTMENDWCCADASVSDYVFNFTEESMHDLEYYCEDALGNATETDLEYFRVDFTAPKITKTMLGTENVDWAGLCPPKPSTDEKCYVSATGGVNVAVSDPDTTTMGCNVDQVTCDYKILWGEGMTQQECIDAGHNYYGIYGGSTWCFIEDGTFGEEGKDFFFAEDSKHKLTLSCEDALGNLVVESEDFLVDLTPPESTKNYGAPYTVDPECFAQCDGDLDCAHEFCTWWITSASPVTLEAEDEKVGVDKIYWRNLYFPANNEICHLSTTEPVPGTPDKLTVVPQTYCHPEYYSQYVEGDWPAWNTYTEPFYKNEESCHVIEYYSVDLLGNEEIINWQCVFVDNTAPVGIKTIGEPKLTCEMPLILSGGKGMGSLEFSAEERIGETFVAPETLENFVKGVNPCDSATAPNQCAYVPSNALPMFAEDTLLAQGVDPTLMAEGCGDILILSSGDPLDADTILSTSVGNPGCGYNPDNYSTYDCVDLMFTPAGNSVVLAASAEFPVYYNSSFTDWMRIGGIIDVSIRDWETDNVPPYDNVIMIPYGPTEEGTGTVTLATLSQSQGAELRVADSGDSVLDTILIVVPLSCFEEGPEPILCGNGILEPGEECDDGNQENGDGCSAQCLIEGEPGAPDCWWVRDHVTEITLDCEDQLPHPVQQETACYRVSFDDPETPWLTTDYCEEFGGKMEDDWCCVYVGEEPYTFTFQEDSVHDLEYYCRDELGNTEQTADLEYFHVDSVAPTTTKQYLGPFYAEGDVHWIDTASTIELTATDGGPVCAVGGITTYYGYALLKDDACWNTEDCHPVDVGMQEYDGAFGIPEESCHVIQFYSQDALGNTEDMQYQCVFVDKTPPVITKEYSKPYFEENGVEWINFDTKISITAEDPEPHPSGVDYTEYRISLVDDEACWDTEVCDETVGSGDWTELIEESEINIPEQSCHLIEVYSVDNVQKDTMHKQCVFVDNTPPTGLKTIGVPRTYCEEGMDCFQPFTTEDGIIQASWEWKVTQLTPITLSCEDGLPHPVNHSQACYRYFLDGNTEDFLEQDWTCIDAGTTFYFGEDSMHQLEYYCEDALGNRGETDVELIKVEGANFDLLLNSKWNLISVPFRLFNDDPAVVFADVADHIESIWTYDAVTEQWYVYRPNGVGPQNLEHVEPGWGYWVYSNEDELVITLGGSLMTTGPSGPPSKPMVPGWNLIGYYGASWELYNYMDDYESQCGGWDFPNSYVYGDKAYCALNSLVDTQEGYPRWSGLWGYINCGNDNAVWHGINACIIDPIDQPFMRMYAGRGYWIEMDVAESYSPATTCIWNDDFECVLTGGGIFP